MAVKVFKPVLRVFNNGIEAVCLFDSLGINECEISYLTNCPKINDFYYDPSTKLVFIWEFSKALTDCNIGNNSAKLNGFTYNPSTKLATLNFNSKYFFIEDSTTIYFSNLLTQSRDILCKYIAIANDKKSITCKIDKLVAGKYYPLLITPYGSVSSYNFANAIPAINPIVNNFEPILAIDDNLSKDHNTCKIPTTGTTTITITGTNFPEISTICTNGKCPLDNLYITYGGFRCIAISSTLTTIKCDLTPNMLVVAVIPIEGFQIKYNEVAILDQKNLCVWKIPEVKNNSATNDINVPNHEIVMQISLGICVPVTVSCFL